MLSCIFNFLWTPVKNYFYVWINVKTTFHFGYKITETFLNNFSQPNVTFSNVFLCESKRTKIYYYVPENKCLIFY